MYIYYFIRVDADENMFKYSHRETLISFNFVDRDAFFGKIQTKLTKVQFSKIWSFLEKFAHKFNTILAPL